MKTTTKWYTSEYPIDYNSAIKQMEEYVEKIINKKMSNTTWLLEHFDVYTAGTSADLKNILDDNIAVIKTNRGGELTYHGIGQRIIYPMINIEHKKDVRLYISLLEKWICETLKEFNVYAFTKKDSIGVWCFDNQQEKKIASIGVRIKKWVTYHGIAVNISTNLDKFYGIMPCNINHNEITSLSKMGKTISYKEFDYVLKNNFYKVFS